MSTQGFAAALGDGRGRGLAPLRIPTASLSQDTQAFLRTLDFEAPVTHSEPFIAGRYPYTYAYDYVRANTPGGRELARGEVRHLILDFVDGDQDEKDRICYELADAYCAYHRIRVPTDAREQREAARPRSQS